jgi:hypothetical protein
MPQAGTARKVAEIAANLKRGGKIAADTKITDFAHLLEGELRAAIEQAVKADPSVKPVGWKSVKPVGWKYIKNKLPAWGLWPISNIK